MPGLDASLSASGACDLPRINLVKPKEYKGMCDAIEVENFLWKVGWYFKKSNAEEEVVKIHIATYYLLGTIALWWHWKYVGIKKEKIRIDT